MWQQGRNQQIYYPGGKAGPGVYQTIINLMPPHEVYIEPFLGGGAVMRMKRPAAVNIGVDRNPEVIERWRHLEVASPMLAAGAFTAANSAASRIAEARGAGSAIGGNGERGRRPNASETPMVDRLESSSRVAAVQPGAFRFLPGDGFAFLRGYQFTGRELVYCDPPYLHDTRNPRWCEMYGDYELTAAQHADLLDLVRGLPCLVMISGYSSPLYARALKGWSVASYGATTRAGKLAAEWVWYNFDRPVALHDYRYLGANFREREQIKRQQRRWVGKLEKMPIVKRQALLAAIAGTTCFGGAVPELLAAPAPACAIAQIGEGTRS